MGNRARALLFQVPAEEKPGRAPWGWLALVAADRGLRYLGLPVASAEVAMRHLRRHYRSAALTPGDPFLEDVARQVTAYLCHEQQVFDVELDLRGHTAFELAVWAVTARIPYGETRTYGWLASQIGGGPGTAQAVGAALASNPVPLIVPCHRVIGSDGSLHGFAGGLNMKARLLAMENRQLSFTLYPEEES